MAMIREPKRSGPRAKKSEGKKATGAGRARREKRGQKAAAEIKKLRAALREKETLLKEIHHRVKNNIQIVSSLLRLQAAASDDQRLKDAIKASQIRIRSISLIHEKLYQSPDLATVDFEDYAGSLAGQIIQAFGADPGLISLDVRADRIRLPAKKAVPCGLIINELVLNALKYAFPPGRKGNIRIEMRKAGDGCRLLVSDDGIGLPDNLDLQKPERLGFQIVSDLVRQLDGTVEIIREVGTTFKIEF
jgi:two-component sensor histidine kinase